MKTVLEVKNLSFRFDEGVPLLRDVSFRVEEGDCLAIVGGNGAGKSTLLWCLAGLLQARGSIRMFGEKLSRRNLMRVGMVFQNPEDQLFMPSITEDLALPLVNRGLRMIEARKFALESLESFGMSGLSDRPAANLSMGERKRAAIAAALITRPEILMLDEPTAELDGRSSRRLCDMLSGLAITRIVTSHDIGFLQRIASRALVLHGGRVIADGSAAEVLGNQELLQTAHLT